METVRAYVQLARPQNASGSALTYSIGYFLATQILNREFFVGLAVLLLLHSLATVQNDVEDFKIDKANKRKSVLQDRSLALTDARLFVRLLVVSAFAVTLLSSRPTFHLIAIASLLLMTGLYNLPPFRTSRKPVASLIVMGLCFGALPFVYGYLVAQGDVASGYFFALALVWFLARVSTASMKDYKDAAGDKLFNKRTFYLRFGRQATAWTSTLTLIVAYLGLIAILALIHRGRGLFMAATLTVVGLLVLRSLRLRLILLKTAPEKQLNTLFHKSVFAHNQLEAVVLLCLILS